MLRRIKIENYKSFKSIDVRLKDINVVIGPNAAGKSNFLDAIHLLSKIVTSRNLKEAFSEHRGVPLESFYYGDEGFDNLLKQEKTSCSFEAEIELSKETIDEVNRLVREKRKGLDSEEQEKQHVTQRFLRYKVVIEALPKTGVLRIVDEELVAVKQRDGEPRADRNPFFGRQSTDGRHLSLRMEGQAHPTYFNVGLDHSIASTALYEPHYPHIVAFKKELEKWKTYYLEPKELMREEVPLAEINSIGPRGENLAAFLNTLKANHPKAFENLNLTLQQILPDKPWIDVEQHKEGLLGLLLHEGDLSFSARLISEGTLRVIGLIAALHPKNPSVLIGYEEPENGVHPIRLKHIAIMFMNAAKSFGKQVIISSHSPLFAENFENENLLICEKSKGSSVIKDFAEVGPLFKKKQIEDALTEGVLRGDFGG